MPENYDDGIRIENAGEKAFIIYFGNKNSPHVLLKIRFFCEQLKQQKLTWLTHTILSYQNVLVGYRPDGFKSGKIIDHLRKTAHECFSKSDADMNDLKFITEKHVLPTYYHHEVAMDLENVAQKCNLSIEQLVTLHSETEYLVYAVGFCPGFAYLAETNKKIQLPRHPSPRLHVPGGSVALANAQTAVYPVSTPAGWNIIGNCPLPLHLNETNLHRSWKIADRVKFEPIDRQMFIHLGGHVTK